MKIIQVKNQGKKVVKQRKKQKMHGYVHTFIQLTTLEGSVKIVTLIITIE
jgi:hypothetical protein